MIDMSGSEKKEEKAITYYQVSYSERQGRENYWKVGHGLVLNTIIQHTFYTFYTCNNSKEFKESNILDRAR